MVQTVFFCFQVIWTFGLEAITKKSIEFFHFGKPLQ